MRLLCWNGVEWDGMDVVLTVMGLQRAECVNTQDVVGGCALDSDERFLAPP